jgi:hypothetical protein
VIEEAAPITTSESTATKTKTPVVKKGGFKFKVKASAPIVQSSFTFEELDLLTKERQTGKRRRTNKDDTVKETSTYNNNSSINIESIPEYPVVDSAVSLSVSDGASEYEAVEHVFHSLLEKEMAAIKGTYSLHPWIGEGRKWSLSPLLSSILLSCHCSPQ